MPFEINGYNANDPTKGSIKNKGETSSGRVTSFENKNAQAEKTNSDHNHNNNVSISTNISTSSKELHSLEQSIKSLPDIDQEKVQFFIDATQNGKYTPNPDAIASKLLKFESLL